MGGSGFRALRASGGLDPTFGARLLKRLLQQRVEDPLALELLKGSFKFGDSVELDWSPADG